ncbi:retinoic acid receptor responder protein 1 [Canis lupus dingo]|uniref:retinoic acid receptor responder protein 1 n=1 Tax=Canis lupus dingo TaxID=286419 RepID=UPI000DC6AE56|nr:retinoic acid receptor responder protein 1 [Canis lupus dingo]
MPPAASTPPAPRPGVPRPSALLLALALALCLAVPGLQAAGPGPGPGPGSPGVPGAPPPGLLRQAARAALHFLNFRAGSPSGLRVLAAVLRGRAAVDARRTCRVDLEFTAERYGPEVADGRLGRCSARVVFRHQKPRPAVNVTCTRFMETSRRRREDFLLYKRAKRLRAPLGATSIPDSHGWIDPSLRPIWDLAFLGSSYVMWERTTQTLHYYMAQLSSVNQWKTNEDAIDFDYTVLLHEFSTQEIIPCRIHLVWYPGKPLKVKYHCQELHTAQEGSGTEEGSAVAPTQPNNF